MTFDNSIPLLLLPYLNARYKDIETCAALGIPGHVTFSSGWEWGYWLVDWSIARWSWAYETKVNAPDNEANGSMISTNGIAGPYQYLLEFFPLPFEADQITAIADLQQQWLIEGNLLRWLCPSNPTDELPKPLNKQFQPRGFVNLGDLGKAARKMPESLKFLPIDSLTRFGQQCFESIAAVEKEILEVGTSNNLQKELLESLKMVAWRASHSAKLMEAVTTWQQKRFRRTVLENEIRNKFDQNSYFLAIANDYDFRKNITEVIYIDNNNDLSLNP